MGPVDPEVDIEEGVGTAAPVRVDDRLDDIVWRPRTIAPVPEEMAFEESLERRMRVAPPGSGLSRWREEVARRRIAPAARCPDCGAVRRGRNRSCEWCEAFATVLDDEAELEVVASAPSRRSDAGLSTSDVGAVLLSAAVAVGAILWTVARSDADTSRHTHEACTVVVEDARGTRLVPCG